eukprot:Gregarina_sp_Pseudo_9__1796@NODE_221_length_3552_cov_20_581554_g206_i0_p4_GENE_NODE_221_length_3552_cov_20_581554_g206_i0NODE_221_length_3552_cov_20_581554_g206_i0_p4_ORF_typecomplete_len232_score58_93SRR1/PF07985_12/0_00017_NODE_221_length_3552_cov_20_581554_g206_i019002595
MQPEEWQRPKKPRNFRQQQPPLSDNDARPLDDSLRLLQRYKLEVASLVQAVNVPPHSVVLTYGLGSPSRSLEALAQTAFLASLPNTARSIVVDPQLTQSDLDFLTHLGFEPSTQARFVADTARVSAETPSRDLVPQLAQILAARPQSVFVFLPHCPQLLNAAAFRLLCQDAQTCTVKVLANDLSAYEGDGDMKQVQEAVGAIFTSSSLPLDCVNRLVNDAFHALKLYINFS